MENINQLKEEIMQLESQMTLLIQKYGLTATLEEQSEVIEMGKDLENKRAKLAALQAN